MDNQEALKIATEAILQLKGHLLDILTVKKPRDLQTAIDLSKVISKLSPIVGNTLESTINQYLNTIHTWPQGCTWKRQDPEFPDIILSGMKHPQPGMELKAWFPLATEITARFRDSQTLLQDYNTKVVVICWLPEFVIAGQPKVIDVFTCDAIDFAKARDTHYHNPPSYIVIEPENTSARTRNLRQKNCNGLAFQGDASMLGEARTFVDSWGHDAKTYSTDITYQALLRELMVRYPYRLDTNFAKIDRIALSSLEAFKQNVLKSVYLDLTVQQWIRAINKAEPAVLKKLIDPHLPPPVH